MKRSLGLIALGLLLLCAAGCASTYYKAMETFGYEKRDLLVGRVEGARDAQSKAQEQFSDALEQFQSVVGYDGGNLEKVYDDLKDEYDSSKNRADTVRERIRDVKKVGTDLFSEWAEEIEQYSSESLRRKSRQQLNETRGRYGTLVSKMDAAAQRMDPVLATLNDQVLYLKHNLNARALGSLDQTALELEQDIDLLVRDMQEAIAEADRFLATLE